jgi:hypothetical protein
MKIKEIIMPKTTFKLEFEVNDYIEQTIKILSPDLTENDIVSGLNSGVYITTVSFSDDPESSSSINKLIVDSELNPVAEIVDQYCDEGEYTNFKSFING